MGLILRCQEEYFGIAGGIGYLEEESKARRGRDKTGLGQNKHWKIIGKKMDKKRGQVHVNRWLLSTAVQTCPAPDPCSVSYVLVKVHL